MKVLFVTKYYPPSEGGIERYGHMLCTNLVNEGIEVEVIAAAEDRIASTVDEVDGVKVHRLDHQFEISSTPITLGLPNLLSKMAGDFDLLHLNFPNPCSDFIYLTLGRSHKAVLTYHSDIFRPANTLSGKLLKAYKPFTHKLLASVAAIIASSPNIIEHSPFLSRQQERCRVIPMPVDMAAFSEPTPEIAQEAIDRFGQFVLFTGRLVRYKGLKYLIEAMGHLDFVNLVVVGRRPLEAELHRQVEELGLAERVFFLGKISDDYLQVLYHGCLCLVLPSVSHAEGFGMVLAEAMSCGKPVISTSLRTGTSYVNLDEVTGFVVPPSDAGALSVKIDFVVSTLKCTFSVYGLSSVKTSFGDRNSSAFLGRLLSRFSARRMLA
jgi:glycosyltransferase involved in cell wall biosynthesis